ncbi:uncharacterized protein J4E92_009388 [Alternaria infectoria]|uniref:uncharacterized protein n=1 Tax=Alternaria infectoria TaxID=45303 RepID=UPI0022204DD3|nr:uncharacterized protein J4E92_009388 [Alternaria infectoria]KAI4915434.1 hypothetical protein J4E92_009388 [Alternaria infectoria]
MASGTKKRRKSQSPARGTASKRARVTSKRTQHDEPDPHSSRAGSVRNTQATSLPTGEDWVFRVKVISSATDLRNGLFKNAVQGLVRICFPNDILNQLGSDVLEQHMREENAPEENIRRMTEMFRAEMTQRMVSMLADNLDTAAKVDSVLKAMLTASAKAHGDDLGEDILGYVTASLLQMQALAPKHSTQWLVNGDAVQEDSSGGDVSGSDASDEEPTPPPKVKKHKKRNKESERARPSAESYTPGTARMHSNLPAASLKQRTSKGKDRKISSKWQWDIEASDLTEDDVSKTFFRTSDLFAYHALPISQRKLGPSASKKEIRCEMQSLLDGMPQEEFEKWVESLQKLLDGDRDMLERQESQTSGHQQQLSRVTPAPVDIRKRPKKSPNVSAGGRTIAKTYDREYDPPLQENSAIKRETADNGSTLSGSLREVALGYHIDKATADLRELSTEDRNLVGQYCGAEAAGENNATRMTKGFESRGLPILQLLWGSDNFTTEQCFSGSKDIAQTIMHNLHRRVPDATVNALGLAGASTTRTKSQVERTILESFPKSGEQFNFGKIKRDIELTLTHWVLAKPKAFPELRNESFLFAHPLPTLLITINLLFGSWESLSRKVGPQMWGTISQAFLQRGISMMELHAVNVDSSQIDSIIGNPRFQDKAQRSLVERALRRAVFAYKDKFPELKDTILVKTWEQKTGSTW